jgi:tetratricopeptide (TPR) repeat protein
MTRLQPYLAAIILLIVPVSTVSQAQSKKSLPQTTAESSEADADKELQRWEARQKAVRKAMSISDPQLRLQALRRLLTDFPEDKEVPRIVDEGTLDTYIKYWPRQTQKILAQIEKMIGAVPRNFKSGSGNNIYNQIATKLVEAGILLDTAEDLASKAIAAFDEGEFIKVQKERAEMRAGWIKNNKNVAAVLKTDPVSDEEMARMASAERAKAITTLGRVYLRQGKLTEAERTLLQAHSVNPDITEASLGLAEIALRRGDDAAVVEYLSSVVVRVPVKPELRQQLETSYRKTHGGAIIGFEEMLDARYRALMPNPIKVEPYKRTSTRSDRLVLAEVFTGAGCIPCVGADLAFEAAEERYTKENVVLLMYHLHRPLPDPIVNQASLARAAFYGVERTPEFAIDGEKDTKGGAIREKTMVVYSRVEPVIEKRLETPAEAEIKLDASLEGTFVKVKAKVDKVTGKSDRLKLQIALVENELRYSGENLVRIHQMVVRSLAGPKGGFPVNPSAPTDIEYTFDLAKISAELKAYLDDYEVNGDYGPITFKEKKYKIDSQNLSIVAFVQDERSKRVLQAAYFKIQPTAENALKQPEN